MQMISERRRPLGHSVHLPLRHLTAAPNPPDDIREALQLQRPVALKMRQEAYCRVGVYVPVAFRSVAGDREPYLLYFERS